MRRGASHAHELLRILLASGILVAKVLLHACLLVDQLLPRGELLLVLILSELLVLQPLLKRQLVGPGGQLVVPKIVRQKRTRTLLPLVRRRRRRA